MPSQLAENKSKRKGILTQRIRILSTDQSPNPPYPVSPINDSQTPLNNNQREHSEPRAKKKRLTPSPLAQTNFSQKVGTNFLE
jgi:hypothetical protein